MSVRRLVTIAGLVVAWCAIWGGPSIANVASGSLVALLLSGRTVGTSGQHLPYEVGVRPQVGVRLTGRGGEA